IKSQIQCLAGETGACGEAVDYPRIRPLPHFLGQDFGSIRLGIARVDDDRQACVARRCEMGAKAGTLSFTVAVIVIIIETGLADADHALMRGTLDQRGSLYVRMLVRLVGMNADRGPNIGL